MPPPHPIYSRAMATFSDRNKAISCNLTSGRRSNYCDTNGLHTISFWSSFTQLLLAKKKTTMWPPQYIYLQESSSSPHHQINTSLPSSPLSNEIISTAPNLHICISFLYSFFLFFRHLFHPHSGRVGHLLCDGSCCASCISCTCRSITELLLCPPSSTTFSPASQSS
jgi:hypothetical protein